MSIKPTAPRQVQLSHVRPQYKAQIKEWTNDSMEVLPEPQDNYLPPEKKKAALTKQFIKQEMKKAEFNLDLKYKDVIGKDEFIKKHNIVITDQNSSLMQDVEAAAKKPPKTLQADGVEFSVDSHPESKESIEKKVNYQTLAATDNMKKAGIGTFNIEWLGVKKRSNEDYETIAQVIKDTKASVLGLEEIADVQGLQKVLKHLPNWGYILGKSGQQMLGIIFDKERVKYDASSIDQLDEVTLGNRGLRPPLVVDMKVDNFDFTFAVIHLKARFDDRSVKIRNKQAKLINQWLKKRVDGSKDKDVIIVGDYNDMMGSSTLKNLDIGDSVHYPTEEADAKGLYSNVPYRSLIDHAAISNGPGGAVEEFIPGSTRTVDEHDYKNYEKKVSDHKPVVFDVRTDVDND